MFSPALITTQRDSGYDLALPRSSHACFEHVQKFLPIFFMLPIS